MSSNFESILVSVFSKNHMALSQVCLISHITKHWCVTKPTRNPPLPPYLTVITNYTRQWKDKLLKQQIRAAATRDNHYSIDMEHHCTHLCVLPKSTLFLIPEDEEGILLLSQAATCHILHVSCKPGILTDPLKHSTHSTTLWSVYFYL